MIAIINIHHLQSKPLITSFALIWSSICMYKWINQSIKNWISHFFSSIIFQIFISTKFSTKTFTTWRCTTYLHTGNNIFSISISFLLWYSQFHHWIIEHWNWNRKKIQFITVSVWNGKFYLHFLIQWFSTRINLINITNRFFLLFLLPNTWKKVYWDIIIEENDELMNEWMNDSIFSIYN